MSAIHHHQHGTQCICQICTCGRHRCPQDKNASSIVLGDGLSPFDHKKSPQVSPRAHDTVVDRTPARPRSGQMATQHFGGTARDWFGTTETRTSYTRPKSSGSEDSTNVVTSTKNRFITSAALKKRNQQSNIFENTGTTLTNPMVLPKVNGVLVHDRRPGSNGSTDGGTPKLPVINGDRTTSSGTKKTTVITTRTENGVTTTKREERASSHKENEQSTRSIQRTPMKKPSDHDILGAKQSPFETRTQNQESYKATQGERYAVKKPVDNGIFTRTNTPTHKSHNQEVYKNNLIVNRTTVTKPAGSGILKTESKFSARTQTQEDFTGATGERFDVRKPKDSDFLHGDGKFAARTQNQEDYTNTTGERFDVKKPKDSDFLHGDGKFAARTQTQEDFTGATGERFDVRKPKDSDFLHGDGKFAARTQTQEDFISHSFEKRHLYHPQPASLTLGDGATSYVSQTQHDFTSVDPAYLSEHHAHYVPGRLQRSSSWLSRGSFDGDSVYRSDFKEVHGDVPVHRTEYQHSKLFSSSRLLPFTKSNEDLQSAYQISYGDLSEEGTVTARRTTRLAPLTRPGTALKPDGPRFLDSSYTTEYEFHPVACIAGELLASVKKNHKDTSHFHFQDCHSGHHYYESKD